MSNIKVDIATAALKLVKENKVIPKRRVYFDFKNINVFDSDRQVDSVLKDDKIDDCYACAVGALMCGAALLHNNLIIKDAWRWTTIVNYLNKFGFSKRDIAKIEYALEYSNDLGTSVIYTGNTQFGELVLDSKTMLEIEAHMNNIGFFVGGVRSESKDVVVYLLTYIIEHNGNLPF